MTEEPIRPNLDPLNFRDFLAAVGLTRLVTDLTPGSTAWRLKSGELAFEIHGVHVDDFAQTIVGWMKTNCQAFDNTGLQNVSDVDPAKWRALADVDNELQSSYWAAVGSDGVPHSKAGKADWSRLAASPLEFAHGGGQTHWLENMALFLGLGGEASQGSELSELDFLRVLQGRASASRGSLDPEQESNPPSNMRRRVWKTCRWDAAMERDHATEAIEPAKNRLTQDQTVNALATIGFTSFASGPEKNTLSTPLVVNLRTSGGTALIWPLWTTSLRLPALEAALAIGRRAWRRWPTVQGRRYYAGKLPVFPRGVLEMPALVGPS